MTSQVSQMRWFRHLRVSSLLGLLVACLVPAWGSASEVAPAYAAPAACQIPVPVMAGVPSLAGMPAADPGAAPGPAEQNKTFLWRVSSPTATIHLLGSIHLATPDLYPLDPCIEAAFQAARRLVLEIPMDPASQVRAAERLARAGTYPPGDSLDLHLDRETLEALHQRLQQSGVSYSTLRSQRPWLVALVLSLGEMQRLGFRPELGIDLHFATKAQGQKPVLGLETVDEQVAMFTGMSDAQQEQMLQDALARLDEVGDLLRKALAAWRAGDADGVYEVLIAPMRAAFPGIYQPLVADRNRRMAEAIEGLLRGSGITFVVVGSGHLGGPDGILQHLRAKGYAPTQQ